MATTLYKNGEAFRFETKRVKYALKNGYSVTPDRERQDMAELRERYKEKFGRKPHHKMTLDTILARLEENVEHEHVPRR